MPSHTHSINEIHFNADGAVQVIVPRERRNAKDRNLPSGWVTQIVPSTMGPAGDFLNRRATPEPATEHHLVARRTPSRQQWPARRA
jgi:hypothetical protein